MKNLLTLLAFALSATLAGAQSDSTIKKIDTIPAVESTEIDFGNVKVVIKDKKKKVIVKDSLKTKALENEGPTDEDFPDVRFTISLGAGVTGFTENVTNEINANPTSNASVELDYGKCRSYMINANLIFDIHKNFGILTGLGVEYNRYTFEDNLQVTPNEGAFITDTLDYSSYKFRTNYLQLPVMLVFKSNNQDFQLALGGTFSYNIRSLVEHEYSLDNADYETKIRGNFNVAPIKMSLGARFAYKGIGVYFNYALTNLNDKGIQYANSTSNLMPFNAGITLGGL
ncbi:MAG: outer membrane beta-barrel protein [Flavobacteriales bacterium]